MTRNTFESTLVQISCIIILLSHSFFLSGCWHTNGGGGNQTCPDPCPSIPDCPDCPDCLQSNPQFDYLMQDKTFEIGNLNARPALPDDQYNDASAASDIPKIASTKQEVAMVIPSQPNADIQPTFCEVIPKEITVYTGENEECLVDHNNVNRQLPPKNAIYIHCYNKEGYWIFPHKNNIEATLRYRFTYPVNKPFKLYREQITSGEEKDPWNARRIKGYLPGTYSVRVEVDKSKQNLSDSERAKLQGEKAVTANFTIHVIADKPPATNGIQLNASESIYVSSPLGHSRQAKHLTI